MSGDLHELSLADSWPELSLQQVRAVLLQTRGDLDAARAICASIVGGTPAAAPAAPAAPAPPQPSSRSRSWWPRSEFAAAAAAQHRPSPSSTSSTSSSSRVVQPPRLVPHQALSGMQRTAQPAAARQSPATAPHRSLASGTAASRSLARQPPGLAKRAAGNSESSSSSMSSSRTAAAAAKAPPKQQPRVLLARSALQPQPQKPAAEPLQIHYAGVFLTPASREALLQHVSPLHEQVSADHLTLAYKPSLQQCLRLPLGREVALYVSGAAADYRAQAVAVEALPSWLPYLSEATPHVTVSVGEDVPAREAGDLTAAALASAGLLTPVARLKLLQGIVGVQLTDGRRMFSPGELQAALDEAAAAPAPPALAGPTRILQRGQAPPPQAVAAAPPEPATEPAAPPAAPSGGSTSATKAAAWDLDALLDQLHLADTAGTAGAAGTAGRPVITATTAGSIRIGGAPPPAQQQRAQQQQQQQQQQQATAAQPRRGLLKLPAAVASEMAAPRSAAHTAAAAAGSGGPPVLSVRRPKPPPQQAAYGGAGEWEEPAVAPLPVLGKKSVAEEAAEAAAGAEPLDMIGSLIMLHGSSSSAAEAPARAGAAAGGESDCGASSSGSVEGLLPGGPAAAAHDPHSQQLLELQFPVVHALVVDTALRMHGGSLEDAARFLASLDEQQANLAAAAAAVAASSAPSQPTLGAYLQQVLPEAAAPAPTAGADAAPYDSAASFATDAAWESSYGGYSGSSGGGYAAQQRPPGKAAAAGRGGYGSGGPSSSGGVTAGWQLQPFGVPGSGGRGKGRGKGRGGGGGGGGGHVALAGDDPLSVTERQAMSTHLTAKRIYNQAAEEAAASGQAALARELQATARQHAEAAASARRRANASAFRSTNAAVANSFTLDLHGQHVDEALASLERYLVTLGGLGHPGGVLLQVITGVGRHSEGNQPRILPAVVRYLSEAGYKFDSALDNPGVVLVQIGV